MMFTRIIWTLVFFLLCPFWLSAADGVDSRRNANLNMLSTPCLMVSIGESEDAQGWEEWLLRELSDRATLWEFPFSTVEQDISQNCFTKPAIWYVVSHFVTGVGALVYTHELQVVDYGHSGGVFVPTIYSVQHYGIVPDYNHWFEALEEDALDDLDTLITEWKKIRR